MIALLLFSLASPEPAPWTTLSKAERSHALDQLSDECRLSRGAFTMLNDDELHFKPDPNSTYESVDCALTKLKVLRGIHNMGFVGNEAYEPEKN